MKSGSTTDVAPKTLEEAHLQLEKLLSAEELAKIDAMKSEDDMIIFHRGLGQNDQWRGSRPR